MTDPRPWPPQAVLDTPRRRLVKAGGRDLVVLVLPFVALAAVAGVLVGRVVALPLLAVALLVRPAVLAATGTTPGLRRQRIRIVQGGNRPAPWWRTFLWQAASFLVLLPVAFLPDMGLWLVAWVPYVAALAVGWWRGRGTDREPFLALMGLDVAWAEGPPTPSGTSGPPAPAPPPPTPAAPATPAPAPPPETTGRP